MVTGQGLESMWLQHKECHDQLWAGLAELGLEPYGARCCCTHKTAAVTAAYNAARCLSAFHFSGSSFCVHGSSRSVMLYETVPCDTGSIVSASQWRTPTSDWSQSTPSRCSLSYVVA